MPTNRCGSRVGAYLLRKRAIVQLSKGHDIGVNPRPELHLAVIALVMEAIQRAGNGRISERLGRPETAFCLTRSIVLITFHDSQNIMAVLVWVRVGCLSPHHSTALGDLVASLDKYRLPTCPIMRPLFS